MSDERSGYLPPHELRALFAQVADAHEAGGVPHNPGPSIASSSPGLAGAALAPPGVAFAADDPNTLGIALARMANELFGISMVPMPTPESLTTGAGMSPPGSPGALPQMMTQVPGAPSVHTDAIAPQLVAMSSSVTKGEPTAPPTSVIAGPSGSPTPETPALHGGSTTGWGVPSEARSPDLGSIATTAATDPFALPVGLATPINSAPATNGLSTAWSPGGPTTPSGGSSHGGAPGAPTGYGGASNASNSHAPSSYGGSMPRSAGSLPTSYDAPGTGKRSSASSNDVRLPRTDGGASKHAAPSGIDPAVTDPGSIAERATDPRGLPTGWTSAVPGRPSVGMPPSNALSPGGMPAPNASALPSAPTIPFASQGENLGRAASDHFGATPTVGGAGATRPRIPMSITAPTTDELAALGDPAFGVPTSIVEQPSRVQASTMPSPNAQSVDVAAPPQTPQGRSPFEPTSFDNWSPYGTQHGRGARLPLVGDGELVSEPVIDPEMYLPLTDGRVVEAAPAPIRQLGGIAFDPYAVRKDFPILEERVHGGKRLVWLDNAATTQKPRAVIERLTRFYEHENSNVHRAAHTLAARATDAFESARETTRKFLNAPSTGEIVFVRGATEGINLIAKTWGRKNIGEGDEILLTHLEHHANIVPWQQLCARVGAKLRVAPVDDRGDIILEQYEKLIGKRTKLVAFTQVSNALGTITPAREMIDIAHRRGATVLLDGAQAVSHMPVDVQALGCDFYVFSGHKVFAPTGIGAVFGKKEILDDMPPWQGGGNMIADVTFEKTVYQQPPWRFEAGTGNIADAAGMGAALDYVMRIGMNVIDRYEHDLLVYATDKLADVPGLTMIGTSATKAGVLSFVLDGQRTEDVGAALDKHGIAVRSGHHCAQPILRRFGLEASVRASLAFYNVCEDIDALVAALQEIQSSRGRVSV